MNKKELAKILANDILVLAKEADKEHTRLMRQEQAGYHPIGESPIVFHLKILIELLNDVWQ